MGGLTIHPDAGIQLSPDLARMAQVFQNIGLEGKSRDEAINLILRTLTAENSIGERCYLTVMSAEPFCFCAYNLGMLMDMPGQTLLDAQHFRAVIEALSRMPDETGELATRLLDKLALGWVEPVQENYE